VKKVDATPVITSAIQKKNTTRFSAIFLLFIAGSFLYDSKILVGCYEYVGKKSKKH
jgi:hypothetical protein